MPKTFLGIDGLFSGQEMDCSDKPNGEVGINGCNVIFNCTEYCDWDLCNEVDEPEPEAEPEAEAIQCYETNGWKPGSWNPDIKSCPMGKCFGTTCKYIPTFLLLN